MLFKWIVPESLMEAGSHDSHNSVWELEFEAGDGHGCYGTVVAVVKSPNKYTVGDRIRVQWPSSSWQQVDELEEFVRETRTAAGIGE